MFAAVTAATPAAVRSPLILSSAPARSLARSLASASISRISAPLARLMSAPASRYLVCGHHGTRPQQSMAASPVESAADLRNDTRGSFVLWKYASIHVFHCVWPRYGRFAVAHWIRLRWSSLPMSWYAMR